MNKLGNKLIVAGVDEVGRGCLFGPVVAAAVILPDNSLEYLSNIGVTDSKLLTAKKRVSLAIEIKKIAINYQIGIASVYEIDRYNILQATFLAMKRAIQRLEPQPNLVLVDGNQKIPHLAIQQETMVKGDQISVEIASASIIAKVWRDELISRLAKYYPGYDLANNKGYGTKKHKAGLAQYGCTRQHRQSFAPCQVAQQYGLELNTDQLPNIGIMQQF
ncbi:MAG: ribonuclease HII [Microcoleaceae cyanobacterium]